MPERFLRILGQMIITCVRCHTEFNSDHTHTHACPKCHLVFSADDLNEEKVAVITSSEALLQKKQAHQLHEHAGPRCAFHPDIDATDSCLACGKPVCYACAIETSDGCFCEHCVDASAAAPAAEHLVHPVEEHGTQEALSAGEAARPQQPASIIPWEGRRQTGWQKALFSTWRATVFNPSRVFSYIRPQSGHFGPLLYGTAWVLFGLAGGLMWKFFIHFYPKVQPLIAGRPINILLHISPTGVAAFVVAVVAFPIISMILLATICLIFHLFVVALVRKNSGFKSTLNVICYSMSAIGFYIVPTLGGVLAGILQMMMVSIGLRQAHRISLPLAVAAAFMPCVLLLMAGLMFTAWAVEGSRLEAASLLARLLAVLSG
jgi:hypothetical protein